MKKEKIEYLKTTIDFFKFIVKEDKKVIIYASVSGIVKFIFLLTQLMIIPAIIYGLQNGFTFSELVIIIVVGVSMMGGMKYIESYIEQKIVFLSFNLMFVLSNLCNEKYASVSYQQLKEDDIDAAYEKISLDLLGDQGFLTNFIQHFQNLIQYILSFVLIVSLLTQISFLMIFIVFVLSCISFFVTQRISEWGYRNRDKEYQLILKADYYGDLIYKKNILKEVALYSMAGWIKSMQEATSSLLIQFYQKEQMNYLVADLIDLALNVVRVGLAYFILVYLMLENHWDIALFILYFNAITGFSEWIIQICSNFLGAKKELLAYARFKEFCDTPELFLFEGGKQIEEESRHSPRITLENVSFRYKGNETDTIKSINLTLNPNENLAIVGTNGAGKTTLIMLLCGLLNPTEGRVLINGVDIKELDRREFYRLFNTVFQDFSIIPASIAENIAQSISNINENRVWECLTQAGLSEYVESCSGGINTVVTKITTDEGVEMSGGQVQKLMLARAMYREAPVLLLDEPTSALDPLAESKLYEQYYKLCEGISSIFISHRLASTKFCDRIILLDEGKIVQTGTHAELLKQEGLYAKLFNTQKKYYEEGGVNDESI